MEKHSAIDLSRDKNLPEPNSPEFNIIRIKEETPSPAFGIES